MAVSLEIPPKARRQATVDKQPVVVLARTPLTVKSLWTVGTVSCCYTALYGYTGPMFVFYNPIAQVH